jgi:hypothetical protein
MALAGEYPGNWATAQRSRRNGSKPARSGVEWSPCGDKTIQSSQVGFELQTSSNKYKI